MNHLHLIKKIKKIKQLRILKKNEAVIIMKIIRNLNITTIAMEA